MSELAPLKSHITNCWTLRTSGFIRLSTSGFWVTQLKSRTILNIVLFSNLGFGYHLSNYFSCVCNTVLSLVDSCHKCRTYQLHPKDRLKMDCFVHTKTKTEILPSSTKVSSSSVILSSPSWSTGSSLRVLVVKFISKQISGRGRGVLVVESFEGGGNIQIEFLCVCKLKFGNLFCHSNEYCDIHFIVNLKIYYRHTINCILLDVFIQCSPWIYYLNFIVTAQLQTKNEVGLTT